MHRNGQKQSKVPRLIAWEITRSCNLHCRHCRGAAEKGRYENELSTEEAFKVIDDVAEHYEPIMILTGGEPLLREDIFEVIDYSVGKGLRTVLATCGTLLDGEIAKRLKDAGISRISISLDGPDCDSHDSFRSVPGAFEGALKGIEALKNADLPFQINTTVTRSNHEQLPDILQLAVKLGAAAFHPFLLVPTGRGREIREEVLNAREYEAILNFIYDLRENSPIPFKPTCAPHYYRILRQRESEKGREVTVQTHGLDAMSKGCLGGIGFAFINHVGKIQICGFLEEEAGDLRESNLSFSDIWENSPLFNQIRNFENYKGKCGVCEYARWCGGCRARAYAVTGDYLKPEPCCTYIPQ